MSNHSFVSLIPSCHQDFLHGVFVHLRKVSDVAILRRTFLKQSRGYLATNPPLRASYAICEKEAGEKMKGQREREGERVERK